MSFRPKVTAPTKIESVTPPRQKKVLKKNEFLVNADLLDRLVRPGPNVIKLFLSVNYGFS
jgi:hypothetical protein